MKTEQQNRARNLVSALRPGVATVDRIAVEQERHERLREWLLNKQEACGVDGAGQAEKARLQKGIDAEFAWLEILGKQAAAALEDLRPYLTNASRIVAELCAESREAALMAGRTAEVAEIDDVIRYCDSHGNSILERGRKVIALLAPMIDE